MREEVRLLGSAAPVVAVLTRPAAPDPERPAVLLLNAGMVHRVGPSRLAVRLARRLAADGFLVARFDHSGIGDSEPRTDRLPWEESTVAEAREVMDALHDSGARRFLLVGLCSGAVTAFKTAQVDERAVGLVLLNAQALDLDPEWNRHVLNRGWSRDYWRGSLFRPSSWWRALTGRIQYRRLFGVLGRQVRQRLCGGSRVDEVTQDVAAQLGGLRARGARLLFVDSAGDHAQDYYDLVLGRAGTGAGGSLRREVISGTDHTFTLLGEQTRLVELIAGWAGEGFRGGAA